MGTSINQLSAADSPAAGDLLPLWSTSNGDTRKLSLTALLAWLQGQLTATGGFITQYAAPSATGFSVTVSPPTNGTNVRLLLSPVAGYAAGTIVLPSTPVDGQEVLVSSTQSVTTLTVSAANTLNGAPTTLAANAFFRMRYDGTLGGWYRVG